MLVFGYIDYEMGLSFEFLCAARVYDDGRVSFEPIEKEKTLKFRYGSFEGDIEPFDNMTVFLPYKERVEDIMKNYDVPDGVMEIRALYKLDGLRAPGFPDDILFYFIKEGYKNEGIWCKVTGTDHDKGRIQMRMLNEPYAPFGKHRGDIVDVKLADGENGELVAVAVL